MSHSFFLSLYGGKSLILIIVEWRDREIDGRNRKIEGRDRGER
jgi:hypothetical protein